MANTNPYGVFGPVCDFTGGRTVSTEAVLLEKQPIEEQYQDVEELGTNTPQPSWIFAPTLTKFQSKGTLYKPVLDYDWQEDPDFQDVLEKWKAWDEYVPNFYIPKTPDPIDPDTFCEEPYATTNLADEVRGNELYQFSPRSAPVTYSVSHSTWDTEMNEYAAWISSGQCSFEGKTIVVGNAVYFTSEITIPSNGTYTFRYRFSKQGEVWLNKFEETGTQQILNLTETRSSYDNSQFETKEVSLTAGTYDITIFIENPTVGSFKSLWSDSPVAAALQVWQGSYSVTTVTGIPTIIGMAPEDSPPGITWKDGAWNGVYVTGYNDDSLVHNPTEGGETDDISLSDTKGLTGTVTIQKNTVVTYNTQTAQNEYTITSNWAVTDVTAYGSGYAVDETISVSYTGSAGGTANADVTIFEVTDSVTSTGSLIWSTKDNCIGYDTTITTI